MATIINTRWPRDINPKSVVFGRSRNDQMQESPRTRETKLIVMGRPLWSAQCTWEFPNSDKLAKLRWYLDGLQGFRGSVQMWDFGQPYPYGIQLGQTSQPNYQAIYWTYLGTNAYWSAAGFPSHWVLGATVSLSASAALGATSISLTGLDASKIVCVQGQYVQVGRRIYIADATVTADGAGAATITLQTGLLAAASSGDPARLVEAACEMRMIDQNWDQSSQAANGMTTIRASFLETVADFS